MENKSYPIVYACYVNEKRKILDASSGGLFGELAEYVINERHGVVFGAQFNGKWEVVHQKCEKLDEIERLKGSKYAQSNLSRIYREIKCFLENGRFVLFSGTPCQIAGLKSFLRKDYKELITVDFICHGVPSPQVWKSYLEEVSAGRQIDKINFRDKKDGWLNYSLRIDFKDGSSYSRNFNKDIYMQGFLKDIYLRPSCYECQFKGIIRDSDITLADFWGVEECVPEMYNDEGVSLCLIQSVKGEQIWDKLYTGFTYKLIDINKVCEYNSALIVSVKRPDARIRFFSDHTNSISKRIEKSIRVKLLKKSVYWLKFHIKKYFWRRGND